MAFDAETSMCDTLKRVIPEFQTGKWRYISCEKTDQERNFKNLLTWYSITYSRDAEQRISDDIVAKVYKGREQRARLAYEALTRLWEAGMQPPSPHRVPRPYGYSDEAGVFFMQKAPGVPWRKFLFQGGRQTRESSEKGAAWLLQLHNSGVTFHKANPHALAIRIDRLTRELAGLFPEQTERLQAIAASQKRALAQATEYKPSHGDFHPRHLFMTEEFTTGVDFDLIGLREPAYDAGYSIGHMLMMSWFNSGSFLLGEKASSIFLERYLKGASLNQSRVRLHIARAIYQSIHYGIVMRNPRFQEVEIEPWLDLVEYYLSAGDGLLVPRKHKNGVLAPVA